MQLVGISGTKRRECLKNELGFLHTVRTRIIMTYIEK
jgi:hypothetical protein